MIFSCQVKLMSVSDNRKKERVQAVLVKNGIDYKMKAKEAFRKNTYDAAKLGSLGNNQVKLTYSFYVKRDQADLAKYFLRDAGVL